MVMMIMMVIIVIIITIIDLYHVINQSARARIIMMFMALSDRGFWRITPET